MTNDNIQMTPSTLFFLVLVVIFPTILYGQDQEDNLETWQQNALNHSSEDNHAEAARFFNKLAFYYWENNQLEKAAENFLYSIESNEIIGNKNAINHIYNNLGQIYFNKGNYEQSEKYYSLSLDIARDQNRRYDIGSRLINLANVNNELNNHDNALSALQEAESIAKEIDDMTMLRTTYALLANTYDRAGETGKSKEYFDLFYALERRFQQEQIERTREEATERISDAESRVQKAETEKELTREELGEKEQSLQITRETLSEVEQISRERELQINLLSKERLLQEERLKRQQSLRNGLIIFGLLLTIVIMLVLYNYYQKKKANSILFKRNEEISNQRDEIATKNKELQKAYFQIKKQNQDINSSIAYAQRIQEAMLSDGENLKNYLEDSFIYYKPRDIVSGDFYWFSEVKLKNSNRRKTNQKSGKAYVIACVDCTGHGVPGAFMSMIGINYLDNITSKGVESANKILEELHKAIRQSLKQHKTTNKDGMELSVCLIHENKKQLEYAGARSPLFYVQNGASYYIKGDAAPIGGMQPEPERKYKNNIIDISSPTSFFMFTDGYTDQFGGPNGYKFSTRRLRNLITENKNDNLGKLKKILDENFKQWQGDKYKQLDDILVMGFSL